jgi:hypothetical protein
MTRSALICAARGCDGCSICQPRTEWFAPDVSPEREGVYELLNASTGAVFYSRWIRCEGYFYFYHGWSRGFTSAEEAANEKEFGLVQNRWQWRGLARKPA